MVSITLVRYLTPREVGNLIGISGDTIRRQIRLKRLKAIKMPPGNYYKVPAEEVLRYAAEHNIPLVESSRKLLEELSQQTRLEGSETGTKA